MGYVVDAKIRASVKDLPVQNALQNGLKMVKTIVRNVVQNAENVIWSNFFALKMSQTFKKAIFKLSWDNTIFKCWKIWKGWTKGVKNSQKKMWISGKVVEELGTI